jgi:hypothetical protein
MNERKFTFDGHFGRLNSRSSPTLSFPCWMVGEGRRDPRLPNSLHTELLKRTGEKTAASVRATIGSGASSRSKPAAIFAAAGHV